MKHFFFLCFLLLLLGCTTSSPNQNEKRLVGNWLKPIDDEQVQGAYMELHEDHTGVWGPAIKVNGEVGLLPYLSMLIEDWRVKNDTLSIQMELRPGLVFRGPDGKEIEGTKTSGYTHYYKILEVSDSVIVIEEVAGGELGKERMRRTGKLELVSY